MLAQEKPNTRLHVGTSGWTYRHWADGVFYPPRLAQGKWLEFFMERFDTVEINMSFYRLPNEAMIARWEGMAPQGFYYAVKMWRMITHRKLLADSGELLERFMGVVNGLGNRRGPLLIQLPPRMGVDIERLDEFLTQLEKAMGRTKWEPAVEFRNAAWLTEDVGEMLARHKAAIVLQDMAGSESTKPNDVDFVYVRRHGAHGRYAGEYDEDQLADDARKIRGWLGEGREVWVYYNNDAEGAAVRNALRLKELLE
ncbi:DUF72 domain-containing protein [bacterium]|nr:DUF72 domain-containing protein [bacterium]